MILKMRCQYCSESKDVECEATFVAARRVEIAKEHGWAAHLSTEFRREGLVGIPFYFCTSTCEHAFRVQKRTHLYIVGRVNR
jgi:hypothetical protein